MIFSSFGNRNDERTDSTNLRIGIEPEMVFIQGGTFTMGSDRNESTGPAHQVTLSSFHLGKYEITVGEYEAFVNATGYKTQCEKDGKAFTFDKKWKIVEGINWRHNVAGTLETNKRQPVMRVSWNDADAYCKWLKKRTGKNYRLPTEAEWEYAAGGGSIHQKWAGTNDESLLDEYAWYNNPKRKERYLEPRPVGSKKPNRFGLYDMTGNVWEWCNDWLSGYEKEAVVNPQGPERAYRKVYRGGTWGNDAYNCSVVNRKSDRPEITHYYLGFRVAY